MKKWRNSIPSLSVYDIYYELLHVSKSYLMNRQEIDVTLHHTNTMHIDTLMVHCFMRKCHDENKMKDTLLYNDRS